MNQHYSGSDQAMNNRLMGLFSGLMFVLGASIAHAVPITVDADDFTDGTDISHTYAGITLSAIDGGFNVITTASVFSQTSSLASTGTQVFGHDGIFVETWASGLVADLRIDFIQATDFVSIDIIANDGFDPAFLQAFNSTGILLDTFTTQGDLGTGVPETATITLASADIAYVIASGLSGNDVGLDNLTYNSVAVPEPGIFALIVLGLAGFGFARHKA